MAPLIPSRHASRHTLLAAGTAFALLGAPLFVPPAEAAEAGLLSGVTESLGRLGDPVGKVVDDVLQAVPNVVEDVVEGVPEVIDGATEQIVPDPGDPVGTAPPEPPPPPQPAPPAAVDTNVPARPPHGPPQGPGIPAPPFAARTVALADTTTPPPRPFLPSMPSTFGELGSGESDERVFESATSTPLGAGGASTMTSPDPATWLFATAAGMLLLLGSGHVVHARHRYDVAR